MAVAPRNKKTFKRGIRMIGAGVVSAALVGVFALPMQTSTAHAGTIGTAEEAQEAFAQALTTSSLPDIAVPDALPTAEEEPLPVVIPVSTNSSGNNGNSNGNSARSTLASLPSGSGASGIANAALSQLGWGQDCTDLAQNALAAAGYTTSRANGGYDMGVGSFASFGAVYSFDSGSLAPGDLLVWPGAPHVAVYVGGGQSVHGGWGGNTVLAGLQNHGMYPDYVVRVG